LTAHAIRAIAAWKQRIIHRSAHTGRGRPRQAGQVWSDYRPEYLHQVISQGLTYLERQQRPDGSWLPLWFGNQHAPDDSNPTYGTARVLAAYRDLQLMDSEPARRGVSWLLSAQNDDGGWGGVRGVPSSVEETALAVEVLLDAGADAEPAVHRGLAWLIERIEAGGLHDPTPIGFYFAKLWYFEKLYPMIFSVAALGRARRKHVLRSVTAQ
jgi:squalene-hopene/tetraprenyl-beta-curcumene cyclase